MNKKTVSLTEEQYREIISTMRNGFVCSDGHVVKPNNRIATALSLEANLGLRISDILQLRLSVIVRDGDRYRLDIVEQKTKKKREFTVPADIYIYIQNYALENNINPTAKLFDMSERAVTKHLKLVCNHLGYSGIGSHSFRKYFATSIYVNNHYDMKKARERKEEAETRQFMLLECQCRCLRQMGEGEQKKSCTYEDMQELLGFICGFCRQHGYCRPRDSEGKIGNDELPFG